MMASLVPRLKRNLTALTLVGAAFMLDTGSALAAFPVLSNGPAWIELEPAQKAALEPLRPVWVNFEADSKRQWLEVAQRVPFMSPALRERVKARMMEWVQMTPVQRNQARQTFQETSKQWTAQERQERWEVYRALPAEQRKALAVRAAERELAAAKTSPPSADDAKSNVVTKSATTALSPKSVGPAVFQAQPGVSTTLKPQVDPPAHQQVGVPKIAATPNFIDTSTLLPRKGPQGAGALMDPANRRAPQ